MLVNRAACYPWRFRAAGHPSSLSPTKAYADTKPSALNPGDHALVKQPKTNKLTPKPKPFIIVQKKGSMI